MKILALEVELLEMRALLAAAEFSDDLDHEVVLEGFRQDSEQDLCMLEETVVVEEALFDEDEGDTLVFELVLPTVDDKSSKVAEEDQRADVHLDTELVELAVPEIRTEALLEEVIFEANLKSADAQALEVGLELSDLDGVLVEQGVAIEESVFSLESSKEIDFEEPIEDELMSVNLESEDDNEFEDDLPKPLDPSIIDKRQYEEGVKMSESLFWQFYGWVASFFVSEK